MSSTTSSNSRIRWLLLVVLTAAVLVSSSLYSFRSFSRSTALVRRTAVLQIELERFLSSLLNAETGERGYLLTGEEEFLEPYQLGITEAEHRIDRLRELMAHDEERLRALDGLETLTDQWLALLARRVDLRRLGQVETALDLASSRLGKQTMDTIRVRVGEIVDAEEAELRRRRTEVERSDRVTVFLVSSSGGALALALAVGAVAWKTAEQRRRSDAERDEVLAQLPVGVALAEAPTGAIVYANESMRQLVGELDLLTDGAPAGERSCALRRADGQRYVSDELPLVRALRGEVVPDEEMVTSRGAGEVWMLASAAPVHDAGGGLRFGVVVAKDITEKRQAERSLAQANEALARLNAELERRVAERTAALQQANTELEAFSYSVSHDLRAPLRAVAGYCRILEEDYAAAFDDEGRDTLSRAMAAATRMGHLIDDLLALSRLTRAEVRRERVDLSELARAVIGELRERHPSREVDVRIEGGLVDQCDPRLIRVVLENTLGNAWKFTSKRERAEIELGAARRDEGDRAYFVRDNGAGFDMKYAEMLLAPFQRLHAASEFEGTGIGLAIVHRVIAKHGGRVWFDAAVGRGATFYFTLGTSPSGEA
ncbi:sensor histidine kinase [Sorangium sp. So ce131]|uniref:sensor histidine kinase n=1 Tax=Sorangium sp. So ce131 TaxID=3133282 RepID=UPI003F622F2F